MGEEFITAMLPIHYAIMIAGLQPEIMVGVLSLTLLLGGVYAGDKAANKILGLALFGLIALFALMTVPPFVTAKQTMFEGFFIIDGFAHFVKVLLIAGSVLSLMLSNSWLAQKENQKIEFVVLMLLALLGMMLMVSANDLMSVYMGMELSSLSLYVLAAINRDSVKSTEAGMKYFVLGALASGIYLFGASLVYGFAGSTHFDTLVHLLRSSHPNSSGVITGMVLVAIAFSFKVSAAPFHMWTPDVYEGAPTPVTAFFSIAPKVAGLALFTRVLIQPFGAMLIEWREVVVIVSVASMLVGAFGALSQTNIKRLLAYSAIGHAGYALIGFAAGDENGIAGMLIYLSLYIAASAGAFACVLMMKRGGVAVEGIAELAGLSRTRPRMAFSLAIFMFSMAGIPPLAGFFGKMYVFLAALHSGLDGLAVIGVLASVVACYYYLKIVKLMYFDDPAEAFDTQDQTCASWVLIICAVFVMLYFIYPAPLIEQAHIAARTLF